MLLSKATVDHGLGHEIKASDMNYTTQVVWKYSGNNCCTTGPGCHSSVKLNVTLHLLNEQKGTNNTSSYSFFFHNPAVSQDAQNVRNVLNSNPAHLCVSSQDWSTFLKETCTADLKKTTPLGRNSSKWTLFHVTFPQTPLCKDVYWHGDHIQENTGKGLRRCNIQLYRFGPGEFFFFVLFCRVWWLKFGFYCPPRCQIW